MPKCIIFSAFVCIFITREHFISTMNRTPEKKNNTSWFIPQFFFTIFFLFSVLFTRHYCFIFILLLVLYVYMCVYVVYVRLYVVYLTIINATIIMMSTVYVFCFFSFFEEHFSCLMFCILRWSNKFHFHSHASTVL